MVVPWGKIAKPFAGHFIINFVKTIIGAGLIGYGITILKNIPKIEDDKDTKKRRRGQNNPQQLNDGDNDDKDDDDNPTDDNDNVDDETNNKLMLLHPYISSSIIISCGIFLALPGICSQIVWESLLPGLTASDLAQDLATDSVYGYIKSWKPNSVGLVEPLQKILPLPGGGNKGGGSGGGGSGGGSGGHDGISSLEPIISPPLE